MQKLLVLVVSGRDDGDLVKASAGAVLARVFVQNSAFFAQFTSQPSLSLALQQSGVAVSDQSALFLFFDAWLDKVTIDMWRNAAFVSHLLFAMSFLLQFVNGLQGSDQIILVTCFCMTILR